MTAARLAQAPTRIDSSTSPIPFRKDLAAFFDTPREATAAEIEDIVARFGRAAAIAIAEGRETRPRESALYAFFCTAAASGWGTFRSRRLRA